jgi:low temperature requirement protein LtrA
MPRWMNFLAGPAEPKRSGIGAALAAAEAKTRRSMLRGHGGGHAPVSMLELFFDLVFVFAITQLSHGLLHHLSWLGLAEAVVLFCAVWWAWIYTAWVTNWANPDRMPIRLLLLAVMLLSLVMAVAIPQAFGELGLVFAAGYVALQIGRSLVMALIFNSEGRARLNNMMRITLWFAASAPLWLAGGLTSDPVLRLALWLAALAIEYAGPMAMFQVPGLGRSSGADWDISGSHMAERCALFIIIALGEGIVVTGSNFASLPLDQARVTAFVIAFLSAALMWLYFDLGAERGQRLIAGHEQAGRVARNAYTYLHMPIVLGIVIAAVGDALLLRAGSGLAGPELVAVQTGGLVVFLIGLGLFKRHGNTFSNFPFSHLIAILMLLALGVLGWTVPIPAARFAALGVAVLLLTCVWEWVSYHGGWLERMEARGWALAKRLRQRNERRSAERLARRD